jgi:hypothetical protein
MFGKGEVDAELKRAFGLSLKELQPLFAAGGDTAEKKFASSSTISLLASVTPWLPGSPITRQAHAAALIGVSYPLCG